MKKKSLSVLIAIALATSTFLPASSVFAASQPATASAPASTYAVEYEAHVQNIGWQKEVTTTGDQTDIKDVKDAGTEGQSLRVEALKICGANLPAGASITYQTHVQNVGWQPAVTSDNSVTNPDNAPEAGTDHKALRVEALKLTLKGLSGYAIRYQVHVQNIGWMAPVTVKDGTAIDDAEVAGTTGRFLRVEAVRIEIVKTDDEKAAEVTAIDAVNKAKDSNSQDDINAAETAIKSVKDAVEAKTLNDEMASINYAAPVVTITGVTDKESVNTDVTPVVSVDDKDADVVTTLDGAAYTSGTAVTAEGDHTLAVKATNKEGKVTTKTVNFTIDKTTPTANAAGTVADYKTLKVDFSEAVTGTPVVTVNGVATDNNTTAALAADGKSMTLTNANGYAAGTYNIGVSGLADKAGNKMADATVKVVKNVSAPTTVTFTSTALNVGADANGKQTGYEAKPNFTVADQYGQAYTVSNGDLQATATTADGFIVGQPTNVGSSFDFNDAALINGKQVNIDVKAKDSKTNFTVEVGTAKLNVVAATPEYTSISDITKAAVSPADLTDLKAGDSLNLTAAVKDQFNNDIALNGTDKLRWVTSDPSVVALDGAAAGKTYFDNIVTQKVDLLKEGTATVTAYLPDGSAAKSVTITIGQGNLASIDAIHAASIDVTNKASVTGSNVFANDATQTNYVSFNNANGSAIAVPASSLTYTVVPQKAGFNASDVNVTPNTDSTGDLTGLAITSNRTAQTEDEKAGNYGTGVQYVVKIHSNVKNVADASITVNSKIDGTVKTITAGAIGANDIPAGGNKSVALTFANQYGEALNVKANAVSIANVANVTGNLQKPTSATDPTLTTASGSDIVTAINFVGSAKGTYNEFVSSGSASTTVSVPVTDASNLTSVNLGSAASVIVGDTLDAAKPSDTDNTLVNGGKTYQLLPLKFVDQYGNAINVKDGDYTISVTDDATTPNNLLVANNASKLNATFFKDIKGSGTPIVTGDGDNLVSLGINAAAGCPAGQKTVIVTVKDNTEAHNTIASATATINVTAARQLDHLAITPNTATSLVVGATQTYNIKGVDQYGAESPLTNTDVKMVAAGGYTAATAEVNAKDASTADITVTASKAGSYAPVFYVDNGTATGDTTGVLDADEKSITAPTLQIGEAGDEINSLAIQPGVTVGGSTTDLTKYEAGMTASTSTAYTFTTKAFDANNNEVSVPNNGTTVKYTVISSSFKKANGDVDTSVVPSIDNTGKLTVNPGAYAVTGTVTVRAYSVNGKISDMTIKLDEAAPSAQAGTYYLADDASGVNGSVDDAALTDVELNEADEKVAPGARDLTKNGVRTVDLIALDQYGQKMNIDESKVNIGQDSSEYFSAANTATGINITAIAAGTSTLRVFVNGTQVTTATVTVDQNAVDAAKAEAAKPIGVALGASTTVKGNVSDPGAAQKSTIAVSTGATANGTITVAGTDVTVASTDTTAKDVADKIVTALAGNSTWTVADDVNGVLTFTAKANVANTNINVVSGSGVTFGTQSDAVTGKAPVEANAGVSTTAVTAGAAKDGSITVNVSDGTLTKDVVVAVKNGDTATDVAGKIKTALNADTAVSAVYTASTSRSNVILTQNVGKESSATINVTLK